MTATHVRLGVKFAGRCPICGAQTGEREWEKADTCLYSAQVKDDKGRLGGSKYRRNPKPEIEVS